MNPVRERLARFRVPLGFAAGILVLWLAAPTQASLTYGVVIAIAGESLRVWAAGHLNKSREVTASGPYRWLAHPLYVGSSILGVGLAVASNSVIVALVIAIYLVTTLTAAIVSEEAFLRRAFGEDYDRYRRRALSTAGDTVRLSGAGARRFSAARAIANGEHRTLVGVAGAVLLLVFKATYNGSFWGTAGTRFFRPGG
jgi:hypothetical protein